MESFLTWVGLGTMAIMVIGAIGDLTFDPATYKFQTLAIILSLFGILALGAQLS